MYLDGTEEPIEITKTINSLISYETIEEIKIDLPTVSSIEGVRYEEI